MKTRIKWKAPQLAEVLQEAQKIIASGVYHTQKDLWETAQRVLPSKYHRTFYGEGISKLQKLLAAAPKLKRSYIRKAKISDTPPQAVKKICFINFCPACGSDTRPLQPLYPDGPLNFCPSCGFSLNPFNA